MCCITINPGGRPHREENKAFKRLSGGRAQESVFLELALASMIREEDIEALAGCFNQKLLEKLSFPAGAGRSRPVQTDVPSLQLLTHDFWQFILTGVDKDQAFRVTRLLLPPDDLVLWLDLFNTTIEEHFSGTIGNVAKDKVVKHVGSFLYRLMLLPR
jgi:hypothetical protein